MDKLNILWTNDNPDTFFNTLARYTVNSVTKGWWGRVNVILWGATVKPACSLGEPFTEYIRPARM
jgi:hypothetical protein